MTTPRCVQHMGTWEPFHRRKHTRAPIRLLIDEDKVGFEVAGLVDTHGLVAFVKGLGIQRLEVIKEDNDVLNKVRELVKRVMYL